MGQEHQKNHADKGNQKKEQKAETTDPNSNGNDSEKLWRKEQCTKLEKDQPYYV